MAINIPDISRLPAKPLDGEFIWIEQDKLNALAHPKGRGTTAVFTSDERVGLLQDYRLALLSEMAELMGNCFWKHWSKEAKTGRRFELLYPDATSGEGSAQNVAVELIDMLFFVVSLLQVAGVSKETWQGQWNTAWDDQVPAPKAQMDRVLHYGMNVIGYATGAAMPLTIHALVQALASAGLSRDTVLRLYAQKLVVNYERQLRGRLQVGDKHAESENAKIA